MLNNKNLWKMLPLSLMLMILISIGAPCRASQGDNPATAQKQSTHSAPNVKLDKVKMGALSIPFVENKGQANDHVRFYANTFAGAVFVTKTGEIVYALPTGSDKTKKGLVTVKETLIGSKGLQGDSINGENPTGAKIHSFVGKDKSKWTSNIPSFESVNLGQVYEGVSLKLKAYGNNVEKLFYVKSGANPEKILLQLEGGKTVKVNDAGELEIQTDAGNVKFTKPIAYQLIDHEKRYVDVAYSVKDNQYGFQLGRYDTSKELVIDPLLASTLLGGQNPSFNNSNEQGLSIVIDKSGDVYIAGNADSPDFPVTTGQNPIVDPQYGVSAVFIAKFSGDLTLTNSIVIGGQMSEFASSITLDESGNVYLTGVTFSNDFPIKPEIEGGIVFDNTFRGGRDVFIAKFSKDLSLLASTFLGGANYDQTYAMAVDKLGNAYVTGKTDSIDFPSISLANIKGEYKTKHGSNDAFVAKLSSDLSTLLAFTFLGGAQDDRSGSVVLDDLGNVYVAGYTMSADFPIRGELVNGVKLNPYDDTFNSIFPTFPDIFISKLNADLSLLASTFLGGRSGDGDPPAPGRYDQRESLAVNSSGVYVTGVTESTDFPTTNGSFDNTMNNKSMYRSAFVSKLSIDLSSLLASTFLEGEANDLAAAIALDNSGDVYVTGCTASKDFPITLFAYDTSLTGNPCDIFISKFSPDLKKLLASTFLGGNGVDLANSIALDSSGNVYITGYSASNLPTTNEGYDSDKTSSVIISKFDSNLLGDAPDLAITDITLNPMNPAPNSSFTVSVKVKNQGDYDAVIGYLDLWTDQPNTQPCGSEGNAYSYLGNLAIGQSRTFTLSLIAGASGVKTLRAFVDSSCEAIELDEANNQATKTYTVQSNSSLTIAKTGTGRGAVRSLNAQSLPDGKIDCGDFCSSPYELGSVARVQAVADADSYFVGWAFLGCGVNAMCDIPINVNNAIQATAIFNKKLKLTVSTSGHGTVTDLSTQIACGSTCQGYFSIAPETGYAATILAATPDVGAMFLKWSEPSCGTNPSCVVLFATDKTVVAEFVPLQYVLTVTKKGNGYGAIKSVNAQLQPDGKIDCGDKCSHAFDYDQTVTLSAIPDSLSAFVGWSGDCDGDGKTHITSDKTCAAAFELTSHIDLGQGSEMVGFVATVPIILTNPANTAGVSSLSLDMKFDPTALDSPSAEIEPDLNALGKQIYVNLVAADTLRVSITSFGNNSVIRNGRVGAVKFRIKANLPPGSQIPLLNKPSASSPNAQPIRVVGSNGVIIVHSGGDCDGDNVVSIDEFQAAVNQLLGLQPVLSCSDINADGFVTIDEAQRILNQHLGLFNAFTPDSYLKSMINQTIATVAELSVEIENAKPLPYQNAVIAPIVLKNALGADATSAAIDITYDSTVLTNPKVEPGKASEAADKDVLFNLVKPGLLRIAIIGFNNNSLADGELASIRFDIVENANIKETTLGVSPSISNSMGVKGTVKGTNGQVRLDPNGLSLKKGTYGMKLTIAGEQFGVLGGAVYVGTTPCPILRNGWLDDQIACTVPLMRIGIYPVFVKPRKGQTKKIDDLEIVAPEIKSVTLNEPTLTLKGAYFGANMGIVRLTYSNGRASNCASFWRGWSMDINTGASEIQCKIPLGYQAKLIKTVTVKNSVGSASYQMP